MDIKSYFGELKRRNVFKAALAYLVVSWIILQVISIVFPMLNIPTTISKAVLIVLLVGFPVWLVFAWVYEVTPEGLKKTKSVERETSITHETSSKLDRIIIGALVVAILLLGANLYTDYSTGTEGKLRQLDTADLGLSETEKSIAVLAFADMSPDKDQEYFSDGISEEILNYLAKNPELTVISRTSSFSFKGQNADIREIGKKLNANYILEGSVRKADSTLRITAQLIHVDDGAHLWSETYDRKMDDIFRIQDDIAEEVTKNLEANLLGSGISKVDTEAYNKYLKAKHLRNQYTKESLENANKLVNESIGIDDSYAPAWLLLAMTKDNLRNLNFINREEAAPQIERAIDKAISLDPEYAEAYAFAGRIAIKNVNYKKAEKNFKKALELAPKNPEVLVRVSELPTIDIKDRIKIVQRALELDPLEYINYNQLTFLYFLDKQNEKALNSLDTYRVYYPNSLGDHATRAELLANLGREKEAFEEVEKEQDQILKAYSKAMITMILNPGEMADKAIETFKNEYGQQDPYMVSQMYAGQNKKDRAFEWLDKAYEVKSHNLVQVMDDPYMENLKTDKRWKQFVDKIGFPGRSDIKINF